MTFIYLYICPLFLKSSKKEICTNVLTAQSRFIIGTLVMIHILVENFRH